MKRLIDLDALLKDINALEEGLKELLPDYTEETHVDSYERTKIYLSLEDIELFKEVINDQKITIVK